jgi:glycosyltransferase involved in cell wall biosynthesis
VRRAVVVTPRPRVRGGNRVTALRWARHLRALGWAVRIAAAEVSASDGTHDAAGFDADAFVALNAWHCRAEIEHHAARRPHAPLIVVVTGTDVYRANDRVVGDAQEHASEHSAAVARSFQLATAVVVLQPLALDELPANARAKARVVFQSVGVHDCERSPRTDVFEALVLANVRAVKDPLLTARAARFVGASARLRVVLAGQVLERELEAELAHESHTNARFEHVGALSHRESLERLARAGVLVSGSLREGGPIAVVEAACMGVPVLATRIPGHVGLLGADHPGLFACGDERALARLLERVEREPAFRSELVLAGRRCAENARPERERASIVALLAAE